MRKTAALVAVTIAAALVLLPTSHAAASTDCDCNSEHWIRINERLDVLASQMAALMAVLSPQPPPPQQEASPSSTTPVEIVGEASPFGLTTEGGGTEDPFPTATPVVESSAQRTNSPHAIEIINSSVLAVERVPHLQQLNCSDPDSRVARGEITTVSHLYIAVRDVDQKIKSGECPHLQPMNISLAGGDQDLHVVIDPEHVAANESVVIFFNGQLIHRGMLWFRCKKKLYTYPHHEAEGLCFKLSYPAGMKGPGCVLVWGGQRVRWLCQDYPVEKVRLYPLTVMPGIGEDLSLYETVAPFDPHHLVIDELYSLGYFTADAIDAIFAEDAEVSPQAQAALEPIYSTKPMGRALRWMMHNFPSMHTPTEEIAEALQRSDFMLENMDVSLRQHEHDWFSKRLPTITLQEHALVTHLLSGYIVASDVDPLQRLLGLATSLIVEYITALARHKGDDHVEKMWCLLPTDQHSPTSPMCTVADTVCGMHAIMTYPGVASNWSGCVAEVAMLTPQQQPLLLPAPCFVQGNGSKAGDQYLLKSRCRILDSAELKSQMGKASAIISSLVTWVGISRAKMINDDIARGVTGDTIKVEASALPLISQYLDEAAKLQEAVESWKEVERVEVGENATAAPRTAICSVGSLRGADSAYYRSLPLLRSLLPADVFMFTVDDRTTIKSLLFRPTVLVIRNDTFIDEERSLAPNFYWEHKPGNKQRLLQQFDAVAQCWELIQHYSARTGVKYDRIVRHRPDQMLTFTVPSNWNRDVVHAPEWYVGARSKSILADNFLLGTPEVMEILFMRMRFYCLPHLRFRHNTEWMSEELLQACYEHFGVGYEKHPEWLCSCARIPDLCGSTGCW